MPLTPFNPPEDQLDTVLETLADPDHSLRSAAELLNTTATALSLFLLQPDIAARLSIHNQAAVVKARLNACAALPDTATALRHAVNEYTHESLNAPYQLSNPRAVELRRRSRETMRKAASLLLRLATFDPTRSTRPTDHRPRLRDRCSSTDCLTSSPLHDLSLTLTSSPPHPLTPSLPLDTPFNLSSNPAPSAPLSSASPCSQTSDPGPRTSPPAPTPSSAPKPPPAPTISLPQITPCCARPSPTSSPANTLQAAGRPP